MPELMRQRPNVLSFSGHDPVGGAGLQADFEAIAAHGAHGLSVVTALTVQDSSNVRAVQPVSGNWMRHCADVLIADCHIDAIKIGLLAAPEQISVIAPILAALQVPVVLDPVLRAGGGTDLSPATLRQAMCEQLFPLCTLITPNAAEARRLVPLATSLAECAAALQRYGCPNILITGGDEPGEDVLNTLYSGSETKIYRWPRLAETFHGAGCTLASAIAAKLACGEELSAAVERAQVYTQSALTSAFAVGGGRRIPNRSQSNG